MLSDTPIVFSWQVRPVVLLEFSFMNRGVAGFAAAILMSAVLSLQGSPGYAEKPSVLKTGDKIKIEFTCRDAEGLVAAGTDPSIAGNDHVKKADIFIPRTSDAPVVGEVGRPREKLVAGHAGFENEIIYQIGQYFNGKPPSGKTEMELEDTLKPDCPDEERFVSLVRVRKRPKGIRMSGDEYLARLHNEPKVGDVYPSDSNFTGTVTSVSDKEVTIEFKPSKGTEVTTPFGKGTIRDAGDHYELAIDAKVGSLVRSAGLVGKIVRVDDQKFTIDYGLPLAGQKLKCEVRVEPVAGK